MRYLAIFVLLLILLPNPLFAKPPAKTTLALMDFNATGISETEALLLNDALLSYLCNTNYFDIVEPSKRDEIFTEHGFALSVTGDETARLVEAGKYLSVQRIIDGSIGKSGDIWMLNIRLIDVNSGKVEKASSKNYEGEKDQLLVYMNTIAQEIIATVQASLADEAAAKRLEEQQRQEAIELERKMFVADSLAKEARKTKLKYPYLTFSSLGTCILSCGITYLFYTASQTSYDAYLAASTPEEAEASRNDAERDNKIAKACSFVAAGTAGVGIVSFFVRVKVHPELTVKTTRLPQPMFFVVEGRRLGIGLAWRQSL